MNILKKLSFVDVETTDIDYHKSRIIEIGILTVENGKISNKFSKLINPVEPISSITTSITGIKNSDVLGSPKFNEIADKILKIFQDSIFVAHNSSFDYSILMHEFARADKYFSMYSLCTLKLSRKLFPKYFSHDLSSIIKRFHIKIQNRHRALDDAIATYEFFKAVKKSFDPKYFDFILSKMLVKPKSNKKLLKGFHLI